MSALLSPRHAALLEEAAMLFEGDNPLAAIEILEDLHRRHPEHHGVTCLFLAVALAVEDSELGLELAQKLQDRVLTPEVRLRVAWAMCIAGFPALALHHVNLIRNDKLVQLIEDFRAEVEELEDCLHADLKTYSPEIIRGSNFAIAMRLERVELAQRRQDFVEAARLAEALVVNIPDLFEARLSLADCRFELGEIEQAHVHATAALELTEEKWRVAFSLAICESLLGLPFSPIVRSPAIDDPLLTLHVQALLVAGQTAAASAYLDQLTPEMIAESPTPGSLIMALGFCARAEGRDEDLRMLARLSTFCEVEIAGDLGGAAIPYHHLIPRGSMAELEPPFFDNPRVSAALQTIAAEFAWLPRLGELLASVSDQDGVVLALCIFEATGSSTVASRLAEVAAGDRFSFDFREKLAAELAKRGHGEDIALRRRELTIQFAWGDIHAFEGPLPGETPAIFAAIQEANDLITQGRFRRAESILRSTIDEHGPTAQLWNSVSQVKLHADEFEEACEIWMHIAEEFPQDAVCQLRLAECAIDRGSTTEAEALARGIFMREPLPFHEVANCAFFLMRLGIELRDLQLAEDGLQYLQENPPDDPQIQEDLQEAEIIIRELTAKRRSGRRVFDGRV